MDISRDQDSFSPISRQGSILTLCHGGLFGISVRKYIELSCFQQSGALLEQIQRSTVEWFSTLSPFPHALALCSKNWRRQSINIMILVLHLTFMSKNLWIFNRWSTLPEDLRLRPYFVTGRLELEERRECWRRPVMVDVFLLAGIRPNDATCNV